MEIVPGRERQPVRVDVRRWHVWRSTVVKIASGSSTISVLANLTAATGLDPTGALIADSGGTLYGMAAFGGTSGNGTVFRVNAGTNTVTTLANFNGTNGATLQGGLYRDSSGNLFGTTDQGGTSGKGTIFEIAAGTTTITTLANFDGTNGVNPYDGLVADASGTLYGTTKTGGTGGGYGTVFKITGAGFVTSSVPEASTWAMMIAGFCAVGCAIRRREKMTLRLSCAA